MRENKYLIGSLISIDNREFLVVGFEYIPQGNKLRQGHIVLPFPQGYAKPEDLCIVFDDGAFSVVNQGYTDGTEKAVEQVQVILSQTAKRFSAEEIHDYVHTVQEEVGL